MEYRKVKSVAKQVTPIGPELTKIILGTMKTISDIVGGTLGPAGRHVLIERFEHDMPPIVTKDGVTVFRALGFQHPAAQCVLEAARDAAVRTASEAGDGTTTATILAEAIVKATHEYCAKYRRESPQKVVRFLSDQFKTVIEPLIKELSFPVDSTSEDGKDLMAAVATISANGDKALADAVIECFELVGDEGNVTITEASGPSSYEVEEVDGYPIMMGYEECAGRLAPKLVNDQARQLCKMDDPVFILYNGVINTVQTIYPLLDKIGQAADLAASGGAVTYLDDRTFKTTNVVVVAAGFSEIVLGTFMAGWGDPIALKIFPMIVPKSMFPNYQAQFLNDLSAVTGATVFEPINKPLDQGELDDLGPGCRLFEATRFRSMIIGRPEGSVWEDRLAEQVFVVEQQLKSPESDLERQFLGERLAKLTGGIAKLRVRGSSNAELKEKRDRAEDAVCAVRGAIQHGCLPGGGWALLKIASQLSQHPVNQEILKPALLTPIGRLLTNAGMNDQEVASVLDRMLRGIKEGECVTYDLANGVHGDPVKMGVLDSTPAVRDSLKNAISIASLLGTLGGTVVFKRDEQFERTEARDVSEWNRNANINEADERP